MDFPYPYYWTPPAFHHNDTDPPPQTQSSFVAPVLHYQQAVPVQRVQKQQHDSNHQSYAITHHNGYPSAQQWAAVAVLREVPNPIIFTWLEGSRSLLRGHSSFDFSQLSPQQKYAISTLTACSNNLVQTWLNHARSHDLLDASQNAHGNYDLSHGAEAPDSSAQSPSSLSNSLIHVMPRNPLDHLERRPSRDTSVGVQSSSAATSNEYNGWCFLCEDHRPFITRGGFIRHMQEHYTKYYCIPEASVRYTKHGRTCALCGVSDPDPRHLNTHNVPKCIGKNYTRKENLEKHLRKKHRIHHASVLAEKSGHTTDQRYFACGFCVFCCGSLNEQIHHIDVLHYKFSAQVSDWNDDKVIRGLLSQPTVSEIWRDFLVAHPYIQESELTWNPPHARQLRHRLEMSQEPAHVLCKAAIDESNYGKDPYSQFDLVPATNFTDLVEYTNHSNPTFQNEDVWSPSLYALKKVSTSHTPQMTAPTLRSQHSASDWARHNALDRNAIFEDRPLPQGTSKTQMSPASAVYDDTDHRAQPWSSPDSAESPNQHQYSTYMSSNSSTSGITNAFQGPAQVLPSSGLGGYTPAMPSNSAMDSLSRQVLETHRYPDQARTDLLYSTLPTHFASPPMPRIRETSPVGHSTSVYNARHHQTLATQYSRQEMTHYPGIDMASGSDGQQPFIQDKNRNRRRGSNR